MDSSTDHRGGDGQKSGKASQPSTTRSTATGIPNKNNNNETTARSAVNRRSERTGLSAQRHRQQQTVAPEEAGCCLDIFPLWFCTIQ